MLRLTDIIALFVPAWLVVGALGFAGMVSAQVGGPGAFWQQPAPSCGGTVLATYCWYYGALGQSCTAACSTHGGTTAGTISYAGTGGSEANCNLVQNALGVNATYGIFLIGGGMGCMGDNSFRGWVNSPATNQTDSDPTIRRVCSCTN